VSSESRVPIRHIYVSFGGRVSRRHICRLDNTMIINKLKKGLQYTVYWFKKKHKICHFDRWSSKLTLGKAKLVCCFNEKCPLTTKVI
jgi:hypothetical protein